jgi:hydroxyethylthiazole kinase
MITGDALGKFVKILRELGERKPLVHHITNYVTVNDCANITLAAGGSPIMASAPEESGDIAAISSSLVLNIGTLTPGAVKSMIIAGRAANAAGVPVIFDPVGAGASRLRNEAVAEILDRVRVTILRGNISEAGFILGTSAGARGVDASEGDGGDAGRIAAELSARRGFVVAVTGAADAVSDGRRTVTIHNGHSFMSKVTGTGCMCSSLIGAFAGASPDTPLEAAAAALMTIGVAGEIAFEQAGAKGSGSFRAALIDAVSLMTAETLAARAKLYEA